MATSMRTSVVEGETPEERPPMTPASETGAAVSATTMSVGWSLMDLESRRVRDSLVVAGRMLMSVWLAAGDLVRVLKSKTWQGLPSSAWRKLVASTMLLMERRPREASASTSHAGEGETLTPRMRRRVKRGQAAKSAMFRETREEMSGAEGEGVGSGSSGWRGLRVKALWLAATSSRAMV